ncbi:MAG: hypothetical protein QOJ64_3533 [Acidobacteriota bacterium]|nr:hypothetical protein [Acidobacteriota bacterium]
MPRLTKTLRTATAWLVFTSNRLALSFKSRKYVWLLVLIVTAIYSSLSVLRHLHFTSTAYDLGIFDQAVWQYSRFHLPFSSVRSNLLTENLLGDHFHPILILLAPLYWLVNCVVALLVAQALLFAIAIVPIFLFTEKRLGKVAGYLFAISYSIFWGIQNAVEFDFHEIAFAVPLIALAIYFIDEKKWGAYFVCMALLLMTKENLSVTVFFFGVYLVATKRFRQGLATMIAGVVWFFAAIKLFIPFFAKSLTLKVDRANNYYRYWSYHQFGPNPWRAFITILKDPLIVIRTLFSPGAKLHTYWYLFHPFLFLSFVSPLAILLIPLVAERFLSEGPHFWGTNYHYSAVMAPVIIMAAVDGLWRVVRRVKITKPARLAVPVSICVLLLNLILLPQFPLWKLGQMAYWQRTPNDLVGSKAVSVIPADASVVTQGPITPHLSQRQVVYVINPLTEFGDCDYIITSERLTSYPAPSFRQIKYYLDAQEARGYTRVFDEDGWIVLKAGLLTGPPVAPYTNASFVDQTVPTSMTAGQVYDVSVSMKNTGVEAWTSENFYRLAVLTGERDWGLERVELPSTVEPGSIVRFDFKVTAPSIAGVYSFKWGMLQDGVAAFGEQAPAIMISVTQPTEAR